VGITLKIPYQDSGGDAQLSPFLVMAKTGPKTKFEPFKHDWAFQQESSLSILQTSSDIVTELKKIW
jgi:hypothetical protein